MGEPRIIEAYDLKPVYNVCNQTLREVISLQRVSIAHVTVNPLDVSLNHKHRNMSEVYYILEGNGKFSLGKNTFGVKAGDLVVIDPQTPHCLANTRDSWLEHLVFASPPFEPSDVEILGNCTWGKEGRKPRVHKRIADGTDGAVVYELMTKKQKDELGFGLACGFLAANREAVPHFHETSDEVYYVISGEGRAVLSRKEFLLQRGSVVYIPKGVVHRLENYSQERIEVLCLSTPPYSKKDFFKKLIK